MNKKHFYQYQFSHLKDNLVNMALAIAAIIVSILMLEIGLRTYVAIQLYKEGWPYQSAYEFTNFRYQHIASEVKSNGAGTFDPELGWVPREGKSGDITIIEDGIRSNGSGDVRDATRPILTVGDSYTFGSQVLDSETWPAQLEKLTGREVINGGVFGYGIDQAFLRARRLLSRYRVRTVIFSFIPDDIRRCQMSINYSAAKPYFDFKDDRLTLENVPIAPPSPRPTESKLLIALEHSQLAHSIMKRVLPEWWLPYREIQIHDEKKGIAVACTALHELEILTKSYGSELIVLVQHESKEAISTSMSVESVLSCLSDPATRVLDLKPILSDIPVSIRQVHEMFWT